ncbi:hypothetical protein Pmani_021154 [Petrolisthes manimaculis]|uniref:RBD domain-containing protein n=1 Tax=Petrolisthes manimaculis TaxID=1843537 RepID=A0AAE1PGX8_9EUCA|nr:hypothetical protein Pmani_021154 [Petrolisthes manimaculis]
MSVTVLCPNGRRVTVKMTPNTSLLQILEEACKKEKFNPDEYNLKHLKRVLDCGLSVRYAGLPNRCQLEMVAAATPRTPALVTVHIVTASGLRLVHDFSSTATLWEILSHHESDKSSEEILLPASESGQEAVLVYTMTRISGPQLHTTTLRTLGLAQGKCMLRHSIQSVNTQGQAHVSGVLPKKPKEEESEEIECEKTKERETTSIRPENKPCKGGPASLNTIRQLKKDQEQRESRQQREDEPMETTEPDTPDENLKVTCSGTESAVCGGGNTAVNLPVGNTAETPTTTSDPPPDSSTNHNVIKLGEHNAIIFSMDEAPPTHFTEEDDTFFQLSVGEIKRLYMEQKRTIHQLEEAPLRTKNLRELEDNKRVLHALNQYPVTHIRIIFPDQHVIQVAFKPIHTVADVKAAIKPFLANTTQEFQLDLRHPHRTLDEKETLVSAGCVPNARLYYTTTATQSGPSYLSADALANRSSFAGACTNLTQRKHSRRKIRDLAGDDEMKEEARSSVGHISQSSLPTEARSYPSASAHSSGAVPKVPKWFKLGK